MTKITDLESELKGYRKDVDDRFNAVEGRFNALEKDFNGKHAELLAAIQSLTNQVQGLTSQSPKPSKNKEQPKVTTTNLQFDDLGFPYPTFVSESSAAREKINIPEQDVRFQPVNREGMKFGTGSNGNSEYFWVQGNRLQPGMHSYRAKYRLRKLKMHIFEEEDAYGGKLFLGTAGVIEELILDLGRILKGFQQSQEGSLYEQFLAITQDGSAREYVALFEKLAEGLSHAMKLAVSIEENKLFGSASQGGGTNSATNYSNCISGSGSTQNLVSTAPIERKTGSVSSVSTMRSSQFKRLTESEMAEKRSKGLCFKCDEKYGPGHQCKSKSLQVLWVDDSDARENEPYVQVKPWDHALKAIKMRF
ncbi:hypothetical protein Tco_1439022 [Tanacetum coccineum]